MNNNQNISGVIPINKPTGMTSHDVVAKVRKIFNTKKVGHTGTLDPDVTGVLPICIGSATRLSEYIMELPKGYRGQITLGISTETQDSSGEIIDNVLVNGLTEDKIYQVVQSFIGEIEQVPPMYSAIKVQGKKLYELAREGKEIERKPRRVTIYDIEIIGMNLNKNNPTIDFFVTCSRGTYIRTLCVDIGQKLGYPAHMSNLVRVKSGPFHIAESYKIEEVEEAFNTDKINDLIVPMDLALPHYPSISLSDNDINNKVFNGQVINVDSFISYEGIVKLIDTNGNLVALYQKRKAEESIKPLKVFK